MKTPKRNTKSEINQLRRRNAQLEEENKHLKWMLVDRVLEEQKQGFEESVNFFSEHLQILYRNDIKLVQENGRYFLTTPHPIIKWDDKILYP